MDERAARMVLCAMAEPGEPFLNRMINVVGADEVLSAVRLGSVPDGVASGPEEYRRFVSSVGRWRIRLGNVAPDTDRAVAEHLGCRFVCPGDPEWPTTLDDLGVERPYGMWLRGPEDLRYACLRSVAVVGSRAASAYGVRFAAELGADLAERGWTVVSGGALGIDAAAHRGALAADGATVAVLANGVDVPYPATNAGLFDEMARRALLVSESPPGTHPQRTRFLVRNRVIAALSRGTVVVEAARRSGALNTAHWARKLNREVMAVPGPADSAASVGCHRLLRDQPPALLVTRWEEIVEAVGRIGADLAPEPGGTILPRDQLEPVSRAVLEAFPSRGAMGPAQLAAKAGVDLPTLNGKLGLLAAAGFVERAPIGWRLTKAAKTDTPHQFNQLRDPD